MKAPIKDRDVLDRLNAAASDQLDIVFEFLGAEQSAKFIADQRARKTKTKD